MHVIFHIPNQLLRLILLLDIILTGRNALDYRGGRLRRVDIRRPIWHPLTQYRSSY